MEAIEKALIATARRHFLENGFDASAMEAIATELGVSKSTLYGRYPSKEALFHAIVEDAVARWSADAARGDAELTDDIEQRLRHHVRVIARSHDNPEVQAFQRIIVSTARRFPALARSMHEVGSLYIIAIIANDIRAAAIRDGIPARDPDEIATRIVASMTGWYLQQSLIRPIGLAEFERYGDRTVDIIMAARAIW
ncbi:TetR/AcrR family transcriptional regulator [Sphingomonas sp. RP10(2022)]|uniref:TetR/AcrR family transcriptional regulator n=1 Tax=Sphingomonas liriopis TaxID=2949094 RepID=A0A9X2KRD8_9SPHN|nr:TetR/AcrR family transcriptional regulator [Sphingomonas liriopis]